ncbi:MAG: type 4a pilus biogenesis protein PilO [Sedimentisphaerales bacterium]|nr:type 4a pilus biogenesis protein PilO [Sedimentisphaerales bacterium]
MNSNFRKLVFFILLVGLGAVGYQFMIKPANKDLAEKQAKVEAKMEQLIKFQEATAAAEDINKQLEKLQEAIEFFESKLPPTSQIHEVLEQVTVIAQKQGLKPKTIKTLSTKDNSGYVEQPLKMELEGNFSAFYSFLLEIEKLPRIMKLRELELKKKNTIEGQISANFIVSIFFQNETI